MTFAMIPRAKAISMKTVARFAIDSDRNIEHREPTLNRLLFIVRPPGFEPGTAEV